jgi:16S rRNA (adenine1518-N6/adenine1519-N6)-dimethyltransferase
VGARVARARLHRNARAAIAVAHRPRKRFGQHFLADEAVVDRIVRAVDARPGEPVVEIGPGLGALTGALLDSCGALTVIELDRDLAARLRGRAGLTVIEADALRVDVTALGRGLRLVGNLPYNISTPLLFRLLEAADAVRDQHFMLQKEVVERIAAAPGGRDYGRLSVMLQWRYDIEALFDVAPGAFEPPPQVVSAVLRMTPHRVPPDVDRARLGEIVTLAFSQRRKLLRHTLGRWLDARGFGGTFDVQRRAEEVPVAEYIALAQDTKEKGGR